MDDGELRWRAIQEGMKKAYLIESNLGVLEASFLRDVIGAAVDYAIRNKQEPTPKKWWHKND